MKPMKHPRCLQRRVIYRGRTFRAELDLVKLPTGRKMTMEVIRHRGSVVLLAQPRPDQIVLIRQYRYVIGRWIWELPAGSREAGESLSVCARRECEEEIGLTPGRVRRVTTLYPTPGFCDESMAFYHCSDLRTPRGPVARDPDEDLEPHVFSMREARALVRKGAVIDMKTVVGLGLVVPR